MPTFYKPQGKYARPLLEPADIDPSPRPETELTLADMLAKNVGDFAQPVTGRVQHWWNDPETQNALQLFGLANPMGIMAGPKAIGANLKALLRAKKLEKAGRSADDIWKQTGWGRGKDKLWRYEIDDSAMELGEKIKPGEFTASTTGEQFKHSKLYKAYPDLENRHAIADLRKSDLKIEPSGSYTPAQDRSGEGLFDLFEEIKTRGQTPEDIGSVGLHELQHAVQGREGFAKGGNVQFGGGIGIPIDKLLTPEQRTASVALKLKKWGNKYPKSSKKVLSELTPSQQKIAKQWARTKASDELERQKGSLDYEAYRHLAGEVEARNVQSRMNMTPAERLAKPPWVTEDIPRENQLVRMLLEGPAEKR